MREDCNFWGSTYHDCENPVANLEVLLQTLNVLPHNLQFSGSQFDLRPVPIGDALIVFCSVPQFLLNIDEGLVVPGQKLLTRQVALRRNSAFSRPVFSQSGNECVEQQNC